MTENERKQIRRHIDFVKQAFRQKELMEQMPSVDDEWERFAVDHQAELNALDNKHKPSSRQWHKIAASFIGFLFIAGIAFAAIHIVRNASRQQQPTVQTEQPTKDIKPTTTAPADTLKNDTTTTEPRIFNGVTLDVMLREIAEAHQAKVEFQNEQARQLRFYFVWKREDSLDRVVEKLNNFEAVNIAVENEKLIVR